MSSLFSSFNKSGRENWPFLNPSNVSIGFSGFKLFESNIFRKLWYAFGTSLSLSSYKSSRSKRVWVDFRRSLILWLEHNCAICLSRILAYGSVSFSKVSSFTSKILKSDSNTAFGDSSPLATTSLNPHFFKLLSKSLSVWSRKLYLLTPTYSGLQKWLSSMNNGMTCFPPCRAYLKAGLSWTRSPFLNQWIWTACLASPIASFEKVVFIFRTK